MIKILDKILEKLYLKIKILEKKYKISHQHRLVDEFNYYKIYHKEKIKKFYEIHKSDFDNAVHFADYVDTRKYSLKKAIENFKLLKFKERESMKTKLLKMNSYFWSLELTRVTQQNILLKY